LLGCFWFLVDCLDVGLKRLKLCSILLLRFLKEAYQLSLIGLVSCSFATLRFPL